MTLKYNWKPVKEYKEILFHKYEGIARISINRPQVHNAFTPLTIQEILDVIYVLSWVPDLLGCKTLQPIQFFFE